MNQFHLKFVLNSLNDEANLAQCLPTLIPSVLSISNAGSDDASIAKLHTRISTLLQSKSVGVRWSGVCLAKAVLERHHGRWETLISHGSTWMKLLLKILERELSEPVVERTVSTVSTIIRMTEGKPSFTRELTTPSLPTFFTHLFTILGRSSTSDNLTKAVLYNIHQSMTSHPTTFRPFAGKLQALATRYMNGSCTDPQLVELAARCFASLHLCAPKNTAADQWTTGLLSVIGESHASISYICQTVVEEKPTLPIPTGLSMLLFSSDYSSQVPLAVRRLQCLTQTLVAFLYLPTKEVVKIPVGQLIMLIQRMLEVTPKSGIKASTPQSSQVALLSVLPQLHTISLELLQACTEVLGNHLGQHIHLLQELILSHCSNAVISCRTSALLALATSLRQFSFVGTDKQIFGSVIRNCITTLNQIVPSVSNISTNSSTNGNNQAQKKRKHGGVNDGSDQISNHSAFHQYPSTSLLEAVFDMLEASLQNTYNTMTKGTRQSLDLTIIRLLQAHASDLAPSTIARLLVLLKYSLIAPQPCVSAAAILSAAINTVNAFCGSKDPQIRAVSIGIREEVEVLIHPRFPAIRGRALPEPEEELLENDVKNEGEEDESTTLMEVVNDEDQVEVDGKQEPEGPAEPSKPAFEVPLSFPDIQTGPTTSSSSSKPQAATGSGLSVTDLLTTPVEPGLKKAKLDMDTVFNASNEAGDDNEDMEEMPEICMDSDTDIEE